MRLNQFQFLVGLKKQGSFSKVAEKQLISQPSISRAIKELEEELGYLIIKRSKKGVVFTEQGELVLENAIVIMEKIDNIMQTTDVGDHNLKGNAYMMGPFYFCDALVVNLLIKLKQKYPKITINLKEDCTRNIIEYVVNNKLGLGVIMMYDSDEMNTLNEISRNELKYFELFRDDVCFYVGPNHPLCKKPFSKITELLQYQYVTCGDTNVSAFTLKLFKEYGYDKEIIEIRNRNALTKFVMMTDVITAMPKKIFEITENRSLIPITTVNFKWGCKFGCIHKKEKLSMLEKKIIEELIMQCQRFK